MRLLAEYAEATRYKDSTSSSMNGADQIVLAVNEINLEKRIECRECREKGHITSKYSKKKNSKRKNQHKDGSDMR